MFKPHIPSLPRPLLGFPDMRKIVVPAFGRDGSSAGHLPSDPRTLKTGGYWRGLGPGGSTSREEWKCHTGPHVLMRFGKISDLLLIFGCCFLLDWRGISTKICVRIRYSINQKFAGHIQQPSNHLVASSENSQGSMFSPTIRSMGMGHSCNCSLLRVIVKREPATEALLKNTFQLVLWIISLLWHSYGYARYLQIMYGAQINLRGGREIWAWVALLACSLVPYGSIR